MPAHSAESPPPHGRRTASEHIEEVGRTWFQPWRLAGLALICGGILLAPRIMRSLPDVSNRPEYQLRITDIHVNDIPQWVPKDFVVQALNQSQLKSQRSILDENLAPDLAKAFQNHPWVEKVVRVSKSVPARVDIEVLYRRPVAMVEVSNGLLPVDGNGVLLPSSEFSIEEARRYPLITQAKTSPRGAIGASWGDPQVVAAAKLASALLPHWKDFGLVSIRIPSAIDLRAPLEELVFELQTKGGSRIVWGRAPGVVYPLELSAEQKIGRLEECLTRFGGFDLPNGPYEIDIRHFKEITRFQLTAVREERRKGT